jgi:hypothetical protein
VRAAGVQPVCAPHSVRTDRPREGSQRSRRSGRRARGFRRDLARPLPATTMFSWFGFPEDDHPQLLGWFGEMLERDPGEPALPERALAGRDRMRAYMQASRRDRRRSPREDLMSFMVDAQAAGEISADEPPGAMLLFVAGITTHRDSSPTPAPSRSLSGPAGSHPRRPVGPPAAIQALRYDTLIQALARTATKRGGSRRGDPGRRPRRPRLGVREPRRAAVGRSGPARHRRDHNDVASAMGSTTASALRWPGWRYGSSSRSSSHGSPSTRRPAIVHQDADGPTLESLPVEF